MTANAMEEDREHAISVGMNGHVAKPIRREELVAAVSRALGIDRQAESRAPAGAA